MGRRALSMDANPVATLIGRVKTGNLDRAAAREVRTVRSALVTLLADLPPPGVLCKEYASHIPEIPNVAKWFPTTSQGELAAIRSRISTLTRSTARDIASVALSRIVITVSLPGFGDALRQQASEYSSAGNDTEVPERSRRHRQNADTNPTGGSVRGIQISLPRTPGLCETRQWTRNPWTWSSHLLRMATPMTTTSITDFGCCG